MSEWYVETRYIADWISQLDSKTRADVYSALELLAREGPRLRRPLVGEITSSRYKNMKELRPGSSQRSKIRILFIFDPRRHAVMLLAGDKATGNKKWQKWYNLNVPKADEVYARHLKSIKKLESRNVT